MNGMSKKDTAITLLLTLGISFVLALVFVSTIGLVNGLLIGSFSEIFGEVFFQGVGLITTILFVGVSVCMLK